MEAEKSPSEFVPSEKDIAKALKTARWIAGDDTGRARPYPEEVQRMADVLVYLNDRRPSPSEAWMPSVEECVETYCKAVGWFEPSARVEMNMHEGCLRRDCLAAVHALIERRYAEHEAKNTSTAEVILTDIETYLRNAGDSELVYGHVLTLIQQRGRALDIPRRVSGGGTAPDAEYLEGYSAAVLRAARERAEKEYRTTIDDCGDMRQAWHNAMEALWPRLRSNKTREDHERWSEDARKEADEWGPMQRQIKNKPLRTLGERLKGEE